MLEGRDPFALFEGMVEPGSPQGPPIRDFPGKRLPKNRPSTKKPAPVEETEEERWDSNPKMLPIKGVDTELFSIGDFARALARRPVTIRSWEASGVIPRCRIRTSKPKGPQVPGKAVAGRRMYTRYQITTVLEAAHAHGVMSERPEQANWEAFTKQVLTAWRAEKF